MIVREKKDPASDCFSISSTGQIHLWSSKTNAADEISVGRVFIVTGSLVYDVISQKFLLISLRIKLTRLFSWRSQSS